MQNAQFSVGISGMRTKLDQHSNPFARSNKIKGFSLTPRFGTVLTQFRGWVSLKPGLWSLRDSVLGPPVPSLSTPPVPQVSREAGRPEGSPPDSPKMGYEPGSPQQREKADRRN